MINVVVGLIIVLIIAGAVAYLVKAKKRGIKCIGCSESGCCSSKKEEQFGCGCGCHGSEK